MKEMGTLTHSKIVLVTFSSVIFENWLIVGRVELILLQIKIMLLIH